MEQHKVFSLSDVSLHSSKKDCWLIIHGKVYDVTKFLEEHPGGEDVLIEAAGKGDATDAFEEVGHSSTATSMMNSYLIGVLAGSDSGYAGGSPQSLNAKEEKTVQEKRNPSASTSFSDFLMPLLIIGIAFAAWYFYYYNKDNKS
ncbi:hypothetical protein AAC387_Pa01g4356 [Persea americana]